MVGDSVFIIIPAYNEAQTIGGVAHRARQLGYEHVIVVDDASFDGTGAIARVMGAHVITLPFRCGAWGALQTGMRFAVRHGARAVVSIDGDGQHSPEEIEKILMPILYGKADLVIGSASSRLHKGKRFVANIMRCITGLHFSDITSGMKAYNLTACTLLVNSGSMLDYQDVGALLLIHHAGLKIIEHEVVMRDRNVGESKVFSGWGDIVSYTLSNFVFCITHINIFRRKGN